MIDRKQVVYDIERCTCRVPDACRDCSKYKKGQPAVICMEELLKDALELLKEQEAEIERLKRPDCEHAEHDGTGCLGYCGCTQDDEPIDSCKRCEKYTGNISEAMNLDE